MAASLLALGLASTAALGAEPTLPPLPAPAPTPPAVRPAMTFSKPAGTPTPAAPATLPGLAAPPMGQTMSIRTPAPSPLPPSPVPPPSAAALQVPAAHALPPGMFAPAPSAPVLPPVPSSVVLQQRGDGMADRGAFGGEAQTDVNIQLEPPGPTRVFRLESEDAFHERMRQEARQRQSNERLVFPEEPTLSHLRYTGRQWAPSSLLVEPNFVCHRRLYFEEKNSERYGWDLSVLQPIVSASTFYWDVLTLPYQLGTEPLRKCDCSAGHCLPGDPTPYLLYPPKLSATGLVAEAAVLSGVGYMFQLAP